MNCGLCDELQIVIGLIKLIAINKIDIFLLQDAHLI